MLLAIWGGGTTASSAVCVAVGDFWQGGVPSGILCQTEPAQ